MIDVENADDIRQAMAGFFSRADRLVGHEANYQALLAVELEKRFPGMVRREVQLHEAGRGKIDLALRSPGGDFAAVFEIKGGAYGNRNALKDEFDEGSGYCEDMGKLEKVSLPPAAKWLVAIDATELGRSLEADVLEKARWQCEQRTLSFAYHAHGDDRCLIEMRGCEEEAQPVDLEPPTDNGRPVTIEQDFPGVEIRNGLQPARQAMDSEADVVTALYNYLLDREYSPRQIALETYFGISPGRMQPRPDMCLFEPEIDGHFNLYPGGDRSRSYDRLKLASLRMVIEVKGGKPLATKKEKTLLKIYEKDIAKLERWRKIMREGAEKAGIPNYGSGFLFLGVDLRPQPIGRDELLAFHAMAGKKGVMFRYLHLPEE